MLLLVCQYSDVVSRSVKRHKIAKKNRKIVYDGNLLELGFHNVVSSLESPWSLFLLYFAVAALLCAFDTAVALVLCVYVLGVAQTLYYKQCYSSLCYRFASVRINLYFTK